MKKRFLLPILLLVSTLIVAAFGAYLKYDLLQKLDMDTDENIISLPFVLFVDSAMSHRFNARLDAYRNPTEPTEPEVTVTVPETDPPKQETNPQPAPTEPVVTEPESTEPSYVPVDESWFDDALFIGESRTDGLRINRRLGNADYFCGTNLNVYDIMYVKRSDYTFYEETLESLLSRKTYGKIFIHLGINECGGDIEEYIAQYQAIINMIRSKQPDAYIILQAIMPVTRTYSPEYQFHPENIRRYNDRIKGLVTDDKMRYIDVSEWIADEEGYLRYELTNDGCHPNGLGYVQWAEWLLEEVGWLGIP